MDDLKSICFSIRSVRHLLFAILQVSGFLWNTGMKKIDSSMGILSLFPNSNFFLLVSVRVKLRFFIYRLKLLSKTDSWARYCFHVHVEHIQFKCCEDRGRWKR